MIPRLLLLHLIPVDHFVHLLHLFDLGIRRQVRVVLLRILLLVLLVKLGGSGAARQDALIYHLLHAVLIHNVHHSIIG